VANVVAPIPEHSPARHGARISVRPYELATPIALCGCVLGPVLFPEVDIVTTVAEYAATPLAWTVAVQVGARVGILFGKKVFGCIRPKYFRVETGQAPDGSVYDVLVAQWRTWSIRRG
jgi:hypothetical protein